MKYGGNLDQNSCQVIGKVAERSFQSGSPKNVLICFNQSLAVIDTVQAELEENNQTFDEHKENLLWEINKYIANEKVKVEKNDVHFTDWKFNQETIENNFGLVGVETIGNEVKKRLNLGNVDFHNSNLI